MKKILTILGICVILLMPAISASPHNLTKSTVSKISNNLEQKVPTVNDFDGYFAGAYGKLSKENDEWLFEEYGYIAGVYIGKNRGKVYGNIYDLDENQIGSIAGFFGRNLFIGKITNGEKKAPIIGFLFINEEYFLGRIMSVFGPAPHVIGRHWVPEE